MRIRVFISTFLLRRKNAVNNPCRNQTQNLSLKDRFWMVYNTLILHHVQRAHLFFTLLVQVFFCNAAHYTSFNPFWCFVNRHIFCFSIIFLIKNVIEIVLVEPYYQRNTFNIYILFLIDKEFLPSMLPLQVDFYTFANKINHFAHIGRLKLFAIVDTNFSKPRFNHNDGHSEKIKHVDQNLNKEPFE